MRTTVILVAVLAGCTTDAVVEQPTTRCTALEGKAFTSIDLQADCGLPAPGSPPQQCHWFIMVNTYSPDASRLQWRWSDVEESVDVQCHNASLTTADGNYTGGYDASTGVLTWQGVAYQ